MTRLTGWAAGLAFCGLSSLAAAQDIPAAELFEQLDKNDDGQLVADEIPEGQARFFERVLRIGDENKDGNITREEFRAALSQQQPAAEAAEGRGAPGPGGGDFGAMLGRLDRNGDGKVSKDEIPEPLRPRMEEIFERIGAEEIDIERFREMSGRMREGRPGEGRPPEGRPPEGRPGEGRPGEGRPGEGRPGGFGGGPAFLRILDEDHNGRLSKAEMLHVARLFDELDRNNDGELDGMELMGAGPGGPFGRTGMEGREGGMESREGARRAEGEGRMERRPGENFAGPEQFFARLDADGDGSLSQSELPERMGEHFSTMDGDGNGKLTREEFQKGMEGLRGRFGPPRDGDRPRPEGNRDGDRPRPEGRGEGDKPRE